MAYVEVSSVKHYIGLSTDVKPDASAGSEFWESDTGILYAYTGSAWAVKTDYTTPTVEVQASGGIGSLTETAPGTDTASSGLNGRLQRVAQRLTSLIALLPTSIGQKASAASLSVVVANDNNPTVVVKATDTTPTQPAIKTVSAAGTPEALSATSASFTSATLVGVKAARTNNVGTVYLGIGATNDTQFYPILPGQIYNIMAPAGQTYDLADWYLDVVTNGDGVGIIYS